MNSRFVVSMVFRELRRDRLSLVSLVLTFSFSFVVLTALVGLSRGVLEGVKVQSKSLLGADFTLSSLVKPTDEALIYIRSIPGLEAERIQTNTMVRSARTGELRLAQVRGISRGFPIYGEILTEPPFKTNFDGAYLEDLLLSQLGLTVGGEIQLGSVLLKVLGTIKEVPGEVGIYGFVAPRIYMPIERLEESGLVSYGSQARYSYYFRGTPAAVGEDYQRFNLALETVTDREEGVTRVTRSISLFLELAAFFSLVLGAVGLTLAIESFLKTKDQSIRILTSLGASAALARAPYFIISAGIAALGGALGVLLGLFSIDWLLNIFTPIMPGLKRVGYPATFPLECLLLALLISAVASYSQLKSLPLKSLLPALVVLIVAVARSENLALALAVGFLFFCGVLLALGFLVAKLLERLPYRAFAVWYGVLQLSRRLSEHALFLLSLSLAFTLTQLSGNFREAILSELKSVLKDKETNLFIFDIQGDQLELTRAILEKFEVQRSEFVPVITMRLAKIKGIDVRELSDRPGWVTKREYRTTYRDRLLESEKIVAGRFSGFSDSPDQIPISVEKRMASDLKVGLGDSLSFNIQGIEVTGVISSIREVNWRSGDVNFFILFPRGVLEDAPHYFGMLGNVSSDAQLKGLQEELNRTYPNISIMDLRSLLSGVERVLREVGGIAQMLGGAVFILSLIICATSLMCSLFRRSKAEALLRVVGADNRFLRVSQAAEFVAISLTGVLIGQLASSGGTWLLITQYLELTPGYLGDLTVAFVYLILPVLLLEGIALLQRRRSPLQVLRD